MSVDPLGGFRARGLEPLLSSLGVTAAETLGARSGLCANGAPVQLCFSADASRERLRVVADPASSETDPVRRAARARAVLERLLADEHRRELRATYRTLVATVIPSDAASLAAYDSFVLWLAASPGGATLALYCETAPLGVEGGWDVAARAAAQLLAEPASAVALIESLRRSGELAFLALEGASLADLRFKIYFRLRRPMALGEVGHGFESPVVLDFITRVIEDRSPRLSGLVLSTSVRVADGAIADTKVDVCGCSACGARPAARWSLLLEELGAALRFPTAAAREAAADPTLEVAVLGLALREGRAARLNTYLAPRR